MSPTDYPDTPESSEEMSDELKQYLRDLPPKEERYIEPAQLPHWVKTSITRYELGHIETLQDVADEYDKALTTVQNWRATPAARKWIESVAEVRDDPAKFAETVLYGDLGKFTLDFMEAWESAKAANDYAELRKMFETVMDRVPGGLSKKGDMNVGEATIQISFSSPEELEPARGKSEHEVVDADYEVVDED